MDQKPYRAGTSPTKRAPGMNPNGLNNSRTGASVQHASQPPVKPRKKMDKRLIVALATLVVVFAGVYVAYSFFGIGNPIHKNEYQAVYTADGKAYFGKLRNITGTYLQLDDVYYLESAQTTQSGTSSSPQTTGPKLVHLGQEVHKPHDTMFIKSDQVVWWENIQNDGKVVQAIQADKAQHP